MHLILSATGTIRPISLFRVEVWPDGRWEYESRAVAHAQGRLAPAELTQLQSRYDEVDWDLQALNNPISADDRTFFTLDVIGENGEQRRYQFSEAMANLSFQFKDLVHFLRHNVAVGAEPVGPVATEVHQQPSSNP